MYINQRHSTHADLHFATPTELTQTQAKVKHIALILDQRKTISHFLKLKNLNRNPYLYGQLHVHALAPWHCVLEWHVCI